MDLQEFQSIVSDYFDENINFTGEYLLKGDQTHVDQKTLGLSSLEMVELIINIETTYHITITEDEAQKIKTVDDMIRFVNEEVAIEQVRDTKKQEAKMFLFGDTK